MSKVRLSLTMLAILAIGAVLVPAARSVFRSAAPVAAKDSTNSALYLLAKPAATRLASLDPNTLATMPRARSISLGAAPKSRVERRILASADGTTLAVVTIRDEINAPPTARDITIRIIDAAHRVQRARYHPAVSIEPWGMGISPDGRQLFGNVLSYDGLSLGWYVLNANTGRVTQHMPFVQECCGPSLYDSTSHRLYLLDQQSDTETRQPAELTAYDVAKRKMLGQLTLPGVYSGSWQTARTVAGSPVMEMWQPGLALSPDGRQIAVVAGNSDTLQVVDSASLKVERTESLHTSSSFFDRLGSWLGVIPTTASAKEFEGTMLNAAFSPNGQSLYVTGMKGAFDSKGTFAWHGLGLRIVDVSDGRVTADGLSDQAIEWLQPSPDGGALFTLSPGKASPEEQSCPCTLQRLDPSTLQASAQRAFTTYPAIALAGS